MKDSLYQFGKSFCLCGHSGDVTLGSANWSSHAGMLGHGACTVAHCSCQKFTWKEWQPWYADVAATATLARRAS